MLWKCYTKCHIQHNMFINDFRCYFFVSLSLSVSLSYFVFCCCVFCCFGFPKHIYNTFPLNGCAWSVYLHNRTITEKKTNETKHEQQQQQLKQKIQIEAPRYMYGKNGKRKPNTIFIWFSCLLFLYLGDVYTEFT